MGRDKARIQKLVSFYITRSSVTPETRHCVLYINQMLKHQHTVEKFVLF